MNKMGSATAIVTYIDSALCDVELLVNAPTFNLDRDETFKALRFSLRNLRTFVLFARKWGNDGSAGSFLVRIEDTVRGNAEKIHPHCLHLNGPTIMSHFIVAYDFKKDIQFFKEDIDERYVTMLDFTRQSSNSFTTDELLEIIRSILMNLGDFHCSIAKDPDVESLGEAMEVLGEHMTFLKSLICFASQRNIDPRREDLLAHTVSVALNAAYLLFTCRYYDFDDEGRREMQMKISMLLQKIKPIDPQVFEAYTQALSSSKLQRRLLASTQDVDDDALIAMNNFLDSLISNLWEALGLNTCHVVSMKDQLQELYEGLRSLRTILKQQSKNFDVKIKEDIGAVVCDAGVLTFSLYQTNLEVDFGLLDLLETINIILVKVGDKDPQAPIFNFPRTNELGFVDFLLEKLREVTSWTAESIAKSCVETIQVELLFLRSLLEEIVELRNEEEEIQALWDRVLEVAYRVECLIDHLVVGALQDSFATLVDSVVKDVSNIKADRLKIFLGERPEIKVKEVTTQSHMPSQRTPLTTNEVVGFKNEARSIVDRLMRGSQQLRIVAIVGMAGSGKTTLAAKVYNDPSVSHYFYIQAWCPISQVVNKKKVLLDLLNQINPNKCFEMTEHDLVEKLWKSLKGRRYLIFLDDIWDTEAWNSLGGSFPDDNVGSRIILTSRSHDVAHRGMLDQEPHVLRQLNQKESIELLQKKLFPRNGWPPALHDLGMRIAENCKGLPLTIVIVAGLLATIELEGWKEILDGLNKSVISLTEHCRKTLELSYKYLPDHLKPCFLYFGVFQEDQEVLVRRLFRFWIAEGFVRKDERESLEDVAEDYLKDLIGRSLIMVAKERSIGGVKSCRIHDLLHDFCLQKAKEEHFFHLLKGYDELSAFNEPLNMRRLCIHSNQANHLKQSKLFCPRARSLLFNCSQETQIAVRVEVLIDISFITHIFTLLRVLDLEQVYLSTGFPSEIELLVQLAFLAIRGNIKHIPSSIGNLSNLETFIVDAGPEMVSLPNSLWNLRKLKYLYIRSGKYSGGGSLQTENFDNLFVLHEVDRISGLVIPYWGSIEWLLRKFPKIRKLKCRFLEHGDDTENLDRIVDSEVLNQLESLDISPYLDWPSYVKFQFCLPANVKKLTLSSFHFLGSNISTVGQFPNLEILKLIGISFEGNTWEMKEGEFLKLRILKVRYWDLVWWRACNDQFELFQKLVLWNCTDLEEMPACLNYISTLEIIEVSSCSKTVVNLVKQIEEEQISWGNSNLKVITNWIWDG